MQNLIKRLQIIQAAIALGDAALLTAQIQTWQTAWADSPINSDHADAENRQALIAIDAAFSALDYALADSLISQFIAQRATLAVYQDSEVTALKMELAALERQCAELDHDHADTVHRIERFNRDYTLRLGATLADILKLQMMLAHRDAEQHQAAHGEDDEQAQAHRQAYEQAQQHYQQFHSDYQQQLAEPTPQTLSAEETQRLKLAYRRASHLCHPDRVAEEFKAQAEAQFKALNKAYRQNDLATVEKILDSLQSGSGFVAASEQIDDKNRLKAQIQTLRQRITELNDSLQRLQSDETYQLIQSLSDEADYQAFFDEREQQLKTELQRLQTALRDMA